MDGARKRWRRWPLLVLGLPAAVAIWAGWVGLGGLCGFGVVSPLPGIADGWQINTAITLPIGMEAYSAIALGVWLSPGRQDSRARRFAAWSSLVSLVVGLLGQVIYHLLTSHGYQKAPVGVVVFVSCLPVLVLGMGATLYHLLQNEAASADLAHIQAAEATAVSGKQEPSTIDESAAQAGEIWLVDEPASSSSEAVESRPVPEVSASVVAELHACSTKAEQLKLAWREIGVTGLPDTSDVMPAVHWLASQGVRIDRSRAYGVRRDMVRDQDVVQARTERLALAEVA